jgi:CelD/BcsL family acetyltransferase involved in cellulose biosynthesis
VTVENDGHEAAMGAVEVRSRLGEWSHEWDRLVDAGDGLSIFERSWWLDATAGSEAAFVLVHDGQRLMAGLPLDRHRFHGVDRYRFVGAGIPHGLDALAEPSLIEPVADQLRAWFGRRGSRAFWLEGLRADSLMAQLAPQGARLGQLQRAPFIRLPATYEEYVDSRPRKLRQELRRVVRRLDEQGFGYRLVEPADAERALTTLEELHRMRWGDGSLFLESLDRFERAVDAGARAGWVRFHEAVVGELVVASLVTIEHQGTCAFYQSGRIPMAEWSNSGTYLKARALERACRDGFQIVDLCFGEGPGKLAWSDDAREVVSLTWEHGMRARALRAAQRFVGTPTRRVRGYFRRSDAAT